MSLGRCILEGRVSNICESNTVYTTYHRRESIAGILGECRGGSRGLGWGQDWAPSGFDEWATPLSRKN